MELFQVPSLRLRMFNISCTQQAALAWYDVRDSEGFTPQASLVSGPQSQLVQVPWSSLGKKAGERPEQRLPLQPHQLVSKITCCPTPSKAPAKEEKSHCQPAPASWSSRNPQEAGGASELTHGSGVVDGGISTFEGCPWENDLTAASGAPECLLS